MSLVTWNGKLLLSPGGKLTLGPAADECCCVEGGVCCCDDMPDTLSARALIYGWETCYPPVTNEQEVFFDFTRAACEDFEELPISPDADSCVYGIHCGTFESQGCTIGGVLFMRKHEVMLVCVKTGLSANTMGFTLWTRMEAAPGSFLPWGSIGSGEHQCPVETIDDWPLPWSPFKELAISV